MERLLAPNAAAVGGDAAAPPRSDSGGSSGASMSSIAVLPGLPSPSASAAAMATGPGHGGEGAGTPRRTSPLHPLQRRYTILPGKSHYACDGRIMQGPDWYMLGLTLTMMTVPGVLFLAIDMPWLVARLSPAVAVVFVVLWVFAYASLFATSFRDPGIIPRQPPPPPPADVAGATDRLPPNYPFVTPEGHHEYVVRTKTVRTRYCHTCHFVRPPRAHHCRECDSCVDKFDHHCPWVANCVGRRNHRTFVAFVLTTTALALYVAGFATYHFAVLVAEGTSDDIGERVREGFSGAPTSIFLAMFCLLLSCSVGGLGCMHSAYAFLNDTTNESMKRTTWYERSPFSHGPLYNTARFFCGPQQPSFLDRRGWADEEDWALAESHRPDLVV